MFEVRPSGCATSRTGVVAVERAIWLSLLHHDFVSGARDLSFTWALHQQQQPRTYRGLAAALQYLPVYNCIKLMYLSSLSSEKLVQWSPYTPGAKPRISSTIGMPSLSESPQITAGLDRVIPQGPAYGTVKASHTVGLAFCLSSSQACGRCSYSFVF